MVEECVRPCHTCQISRKGQKSHGKLPPKEAKANLWEVPCMDLTGPHKIPRKGKRPLKLWCVAMMDPTTGWFEIKDIPDKRPETIANVV